MDVLYMSNNVRRISRQNLTAPAYLKMLDSIGIIIKFSASIVHIISDFEITVTCTLRHVCSPM